MFIMGRNALAPAAAHPHPDAEPESEPERTSLPASDASASEWTRRGQHVYSEHLSNKSDVETAQESRVERPEETVSA